MTSTATSTSSSIKAQLERARRTVWSAYGKSTAVLSGDALAAAAITHLSAVGSAPSRQATSTAPCARPRSTSARSATCGRCTVWKANRSSRYSTSGLRAGVETQFLDGYRSHRLNYLVIVAERANTSERVTPCCKSLSFSFH